MAEVETKVEWITLRVPVARSVGYAPRTALSLTHDQARALADLHDGLVATDATLSHGGGPREFECGLRFLMDSNATAERSAT